MAGSRALKTSFTAGEVAPELLGRPDLRAWANGARRLRNVFIQTCSSNRPAAWCAGPACGTSPRCPAPRA